MSATMSRRPLATIIIPTYNDVEDLHRALELACAQTLRDIEIIVVDDCSTIPVEPDVREIVDSDPRVSVIRRASNGGVFEAQNTGIKAAHGKYIYLGSTN